MQEKQKQLQQQQQQDQFKEQQKQQEQPQRDQQPTPPKPLPRGERKSSICQSPTIEGMVAIPPVAPPRRPKSEIIKEPENTFFEVSKNREGDDMFVSKVDDISTEDEYEEEEIGDYVGFKSAASSSYPGEVRKPRASSSNECSSKSPDNDSTKNAYESIPDRVRKTQSLDLLRRKSSGNFPLPFSFLKRDKKNLQSFDEKDADERNEKGKTR